MSRVPVKTFVLLSRRSYAVSAAAEGTREPATRAAVGVAAESKETAKAEVFWMRDPKTGCWIPENRFGEVDPAELRARLLSKK